MRHLATYLRGSRHLELIHSTSALCTKSFASLIFHTLLFQALSLGPFFLSLSLSICLSLSLGRVFYIFVVRFSNGLARVSSASSVAHFEVGTSGGTFAPRTPQCDTTTESAPRSLFSRRTGIMRLFFTLR